MPPIANPLTNFPFYEYWDTLPDLITQGYVNPFKYKERVAIYKLLIENMNPNKALGANDELNSFWGFVSQLDWQWRSGRLVAPKDFEAENAPKPETISMESWWGCCNYALSVIPLVSAMRMGVVLPIGIGMPKKAPPNKFINAGGLTRPWVVPKVYETALEKWGEFFRIIKKQKMGEDLEPMRKASWSAHLESITAAMHLYHSELAMMPKNEQIFGTGWVRMVDFLGEAAWRTDLNFMLEHGRGDLPPRVLNDTDRLGASMDFNVATNHSVMSIATLGTSNRYRYRFNQWVWQRAMRTRAARDEAPRLLAASFDNSPKYAPDRKKLRGYILSV
jgi:hypothetical protein